MKNVEIREVLTKKDRRRFVDFVNDLYKVNPYYCPPIYSDEIKLFEPGKNTALEVCDTKCFMAYVDNRPVGRIAGIINYESNKAWNNKRVRFGHFDFIDDYRVSQALLSAVEEWGKSKGMTEINGPVGFTDFDQQGLLIEGFEYPSPIFSLYSSPYYAAHHEAFGLKKEIDWIEYRVNPPKQIPDKMLRVGNIIQEKYKYKTIKVKNAKELKKRFGYEYMDLIDLAYQPLYNFQPLTKEQKQEFAESYMPMLNFDFLTLVTTSDDELIGIGVGLPDISDALRACGGKLFPFGWYKLLKALKSKKIESFDLLLIAVHPDHQNKGVNALFFIDQLKYFIQYEIKHVETTAILESNTKSLGNYRDFDKIQHKRRRAYIKNID